MSDVLDIRQVAEIAHTLVREYNLTVYGQDYDNIKKFEDLSIRQNAAICIAVKNELDYPAKNNEASHARWKASREQDGWKYGQKLDRENKIHPNLTDYSKLPMEEKVKDTLFRKTVALLKPYIKKELLKKETI